MITDDDVINNGDGETSHDSCYVENVVQANILAAVASGPALAQVYNVAAGMRTSLTELFNLIRDALIQRGIRYDRSPVYSQFRN